MGFPVVMAGTTLPPPQWQRTPSQDKPPQHLFNLPNLLNNSSPLPQSSNNSPHLAGEASNRSSHLTSNSSRLLLSLSQHLPPISQQPGEASSQRQHSSPPKVLLLISNSNKQQRQSLHSLQLLFLQSTKSSKMSWRASDQNVNKHPVTLRLGGNWKMFPQSWTSSTTS